MEKFEERDSVVLQNDGQKIFGVIHRPLFAKKYPAVLICHGLGGHKTGRYKLYVKLSQTLATLGICSLRFDFRGSGDSEGDFSDMTVNSQLSDAVLALNYLKEDKNIDQDRIGMFGRSFGGLIAVLTARQAGNIKSMALWAPVFNGHQWREKWDFLHSPAVTDEEREVMMSVNGMTPGPKFFHELFALKLEKDFQLLGDLPLFHVHGEKDDMVDLSHAKQYEDLRKHAYGETRFLLLPNSDHDFSNFKEQRFLINETAQWFRKTLM